MDTLRQDTLMGRTKRISRFGFFTDNGHYGRPAILLCGWIFSIRYPC